MAFNDEDYSAYFSPEVLRKQREEDEELARKTRQKQSVNTLGDAIMRAASKVGAFAGGPTAEATEMAPGQNKILQDYLATKMGQRKEERGHQLAGLKEQLRQQLLAKTQDTKKTESEAEAAYRKDELGIKKEALNIEKSKVAQAGEKIKSEKIKTPEDLKGDDRKRYDNVVSALGSVQDMSDALAKGDFTYKPIGTNDFLMARTIWEEALGRMQSGAQISSTEEARFRSMVPQPTDTKEQMKVKLQRAANEMASRLSSMGYNPQETMAKRKETQFTISPGTAMAKPSSQPDITLEDIQRERERRKMVKP